VNLLDKSSKSLSTIWQLFGSGRDVRIPGPLQGRKQGGMKGMIRRLIIFSLVILCLQPSRLFANGFNLNAKFHGIGASVDYAYSKELHDGGVYASYRGGWVSFGSYFLQADVGYRFMNKSIQARVGAEVLIMFVGLEAGIIASFRVEEREKYFYRHEKKIVSAPGIYLGLAGAVPTPDAGVFLSTGGNFFFISHELEFYIMVTGLFNLAR
jgi:hypothetical protein